jgi:hypothetical protein
MSASLLRRPDTADDARRPQSGFPERCEPQRSDRLLGALAEMAVTFARCGELAAARHAADEALGMFRDAHDAAAIARASLDLGEALLVLGDPTCRELLEDAGTLFEDLGDEAAVLCVDALLRTAQASIEESPRSFQARPGFRV